MSTGGIEQQQIPLQTQFTREGSSTHIIESLGLKNSNAGRTPVFKDQCAKELYKHITTEVRRLVEDTTQELQAATRKPKFLHDEVEIILARFGPTLWGRKDRSHLLHPRADTRYPEDLYFDIPEHRERQVQVLTVRR